MTHIAAIRRLALAGAVVAQLVGAAPGAAAASPEADIPGVPLPGPVASGLLGGPIYDVVYRFAVQSGYVIVAGLSGTSGTDFDMYLFDSTATTVVSNRGLVAKSTGTGSTERLNYPSFSGGTYYLDLNGASDVQGTYTLTLQVVQDSTVPTASLLLAGGSASTNSTAVDVTLTASGGIAGIGAMAFSPDGVTFGPWQAYTIVTTWTFPAGDGPKTLWAKVRSGTGVESATVSASIDLDTTPPSVTVLSPTPNTSVAGLRPMFTVGFNEPIQPSSWADHGLVVQAGNGSVVAGTHAYDARTSAGTFVPSEDLVPGAPYVVTVGPVRDIAGNTIVPLGSWLVVPKAPTSITLTTSASTVPWGASVALAGTATGLDGQTVALEARTGGSGDFSVIGGLAVAGGRVTAAVTPQAITTYRASYAGSATAAATTSNEVRVLVRRLVSLVGVSPSTTRTVRAGSSVTLTAQVSPPGGGARLSFRLYRYDASRRAYVYYRSVGRTTDSLGRASVVWTATPGRYYWRVAALSSADYANNVSPVYRWTVTAR